MEDAGNNYSVVINARLESKRLPRKLVRPFAGTTLLDIALTKLSRISCTNKYFAAHEEEEELMAIYKKYEDRIRFLPRSHKSVVQGKKHQGVTFEHYRDMPTQYIMSLNPCAPMVAVNTLFDALSAFDNGNMRTMTSVTTEDNIFFDENGVLNAESYDVSTQGNRPIYRMAHLFHIFDKEFFIQNGYFWDYSHNNPSLYVVRTSESADIDYLEDFQYCEWLYEKIISPNCK